MRRASLLVVALLGCDRASRIAPTTNEERAPVAPESALPSVRTRADTIRFDGRRAVVEGFYELAPLGKATVTIVLADGTQVFDARGPAGADLAFLGRKVRAIGTVHRGAPPDKLQAPSGPHVVPERVELAAGETPIVPTPTVLPAPPVATSSPQLSAHIDRWVQVQGTLDAVAKGSTFTSATVRLGDGTIVRVERVNDAEWSPHVGAPVTVVGRLEVDKSAAAFALALVIRGANALCPGHVARCAL